MLAGRVHPDRRGDRADHPDRPLGAARGLPSRAPRAARRARLRMSVNLSLKQIQHSDIVADVRDALDDSGLPPERLTLEITESVLMDDTELAVERLCELKALGVTLALDDFGTGYSSLSYLSRFPVDILKMDRSFLRRGRDAGRAQPRQRRRRARRHARARGRRGGHRATRTGRRRCAALGCDLGQGFHFARPMDAEASLAFIAGHLQLAPDAP